MIRAAVIDNGSSTARNGNSRRDATIPQRHALAVHRVGVQRRVWSNWAFATAAEYPPISRSTDQLAQRHCHGAFTALPLGAYVIQRNAAGEPITWEMAYGRSTRLVPTKDPIVEHGVQQIRHLDHYNDGLTHRLCNARPTGPFTLERHWYAVRNFQPSTTPVAAMNATESQCKLPP